MLTEVMGGAVEVTLRQPPPLERALQFEMDEHTREAQLLDGDQLIASARASVLDIQVPSAPTFAEAERCATRFAGFHSHAFPECFVCGPARSEADGLRIFSGHSADGALVAAPWCPDASLANAQREIRIAVGWAALDCSGYFAAAHPELALLGKMCAHVPAALDASQRYVVIGWSLGRDGRKVYAGTALFDEQGVLRGCAKQTWITAKNETH